MCGVLDTKRDIPFIFSYYDDQRQIRGCVTRMRKREERSAAWHCQCITSKRLARRTTFGSRLNRTKSSKVLSFQDSKCMP